MTARFVYLFLTVTAGLIAFFGWKLTARAAYESADYQVIESDGEFEIRKYPDLVLATTRAKFEEQGDDGSFMRLFRYISGANEPKQEIAMTTPVFMQRQSEDKDGSMSFVIPKNVVGQGTPQPASEEVGLQKRAGGRFAVVRFAGRLNEKSYADNERRLREWMSERGLAGAESAESAAYDPPWTPNPMRRNEVLIRIKD